MKHGADEGVESAPARSPENGVPETRKRVHGRRNFGIVVVVLLALGALGRAMLPAFVRDYVNRTMDKSLLYKGRIGEIQIHFLRGAYSISDIRLSKNTGNVPVPLFVAKRVDFSMQWSALRHGRVVGLISMIEPELNFVDSPSADQSQTGVGGPWLQIIRDLFPFRINSAKIQDGSVHFRVVQKKSLLDVYLSHVEASIDNLTNIRGDTAPLIATVQVDSLVMDQAKLELRMTLDPFAYRPTFHLAVRMLGLDVTKLNELSLAYGDFDFKAGWLDLVIETDAREGALTGYIKPLFRDLKLFNLREDMKEDNAPQFFWQALLGVTTTIFKNQPRNQLATVIPFTGEISGQTSADVLTTLGNVLRNAFVRAYLPRLESGLSAVDGLQFGAPEISAPVSSGEL